MSKIWEKHQGLWRWYNDERFIPFKKKVKYSINDANLKSKNVFIKKNGGFGPVKAELIQKEYIKKGMMSHEQQWFEQDHWAYDDKTGYVYRIKMEDGVEVERKLCGEVPIGTTPQQVGLRIEDRDITSRDAYNPEDKRRHMAWTEMNRLDWSWEFDGKSILALCIVKPKMTYAEIKRVIEMEGGSIDEQGIIHKNPKYCH